VRFSYIIFFLLGATSLSRCASQQPFGESYLKLQTTIAMPHVKGRIDHMDVDLKNKILFVAALGNNTVELIDLNAGKVVHSISGLREPQGVGYVPQTNEVLVANGGNGDCNFFNASNFQKTATVHLDGDADDVRYDSVDHTLYVGYGDGGIAVIDAISHKLIANISLPAHPEGFQLDKLLNRIIVNVPDKNGIAILDASQRTTSDFWKRNSPSANFPMAIDAAHHQVFVGYRHPAKLAMFDIQNGKEVTSVNMVSDADDVYFDPRSDRLYVSGGGGFINIFQLNNDSITQIANIQTREGARTSLLVPALNIFILAARPQAGNSAQIMVYQTHQ